MDVEQDAQEPHDRQHRQIGVQRATGRSHFRTAIADALDTRLQPPQLTDQVCPVHIAARLSCGKENLHARFACRETTSFELVSTASNRSDTWQPSSPTTRRALSEIWPDSNSCAS